MPLQRQKSTYRPKPSERDFYFAELSPRDSRQSPAAGRTSSYWRVCGFSLVSLCALSYESGSVNGHARYQSARYAAPMPETRVSLFRRHARAPANMVRLFTALIRQNSIKCRRSHDAAVRRYHFHTTDIGSVLFCTHDGMLCLQTC